MRSLILIDLLLLLLFPLVPTAAITCPTKLIYQYPQGTWLENIAIRSNGHILLTSLNHPGGLSSLDPFSPHPKPLQILPPTSFPGVNSTLGIVETYPDIFYIVGNNFSLSGGKIGVKHGTNAVFKVDLTTDPHPKVTKVAGRGSLGDEVQFLNGLTKFNDSILLAADSGRGIIWAIDITSGGRAWVAAEDKLMKPEPSEDGGFAEGINGVHFQRSFGRWGGDGDESVAYFTNSQRRFFAKVHLDGNAKQVGSAEFIANSVTQKGVKVLWDDFALDDSGYKWLATEMGNGVQRVGLRDGKVEVVAGNLNSTALAQPTSTAFGRTKMDREWLYVVTAGGLAYPVYVGGMPLRLGAQVVAVDTGRCN